MYHNKLTRQEVLDVDLWKDSLCESKKQSGYPAKNFGVSLSNENVMLLGAKSFEFEIKNESNRKWYWDETFISEWAGDKPGWNMVSDSSQG